MQLRGRRQNDVETVRSSTVLASEQRNLLISDFKSFSMELKASWRKSGFKGSLFFLLKLQDIFSPQASRYLFSSSFKKIVLFKLQEIFSLQASRDFFSSSFKRFFLLKLQEIFSLQASRDASQLKDYF